MPVDQIWRGTESLGVEMHLDCSAVELDARQHLVYDHKGQSYRYTKLLIATGGSPIRLANDGGAVLYYRDFPDYIRLRALCQTAHRFAVIGGGFIGSELAALLNEQNKEVTMLFMEDGICGRFLPPETSQALNRLYVQRGIKILANRQVDQIMIKNNIWLVQTVQGDIIEVDAVIAGLGIRPNTQLAAQAGLTLENGIRVDASMRTSDPDIYAAGDVISYPDPFQGKQIRVEHEEHANLSGQVAGENMAGGQETYQHMPSVYATLFDIHYDAVGELNPRLETFADWIEPYRTGSLYYLSAGRIRGVMLWNIQGKLEDARKLIKDSKQYELSELKGLITPQRPSARRVLRVVRSTPAADTL